MPDDAVELPPQGNARCSRERQATIARLGTPVRTRLQIGQVLALLFVVLSVTPYIALAQLGDILPHAYRTGPGSDPRQVSGVVMVLVSTYSTRLPLYFLVLLIAHLADPSLRDCLRRDIVARISHASLSWFTVSTLGRLREVVQGDTALVHIVIAHGPVECLNVIAIPLALLGCTFWIDWRLASLAIFALILYALTCSVFMRGMNEETVEMDRKLAATSSAMIEFISRIDVVRAFGRAGRVYSIHLIAADKFSTPHRVWAMPLATTTCPSLTWASIPVLLLVSLGGGVLFIHAGAVVLPQVLTITLVVLALPTALITIAPISWPYQLVDAVALRLYEVPDIPVLPVADRPAQPRAERVETNHASPSYGEVLAVDGVRLVLELGTVTALLGSFGPGRSTLAILTVRFADPDAGAVHIGGVDLRDMDEFTPYSTVSFVLQGVQLPTTTVRKSIALGCPRVDLAQVRTAARVAHIYEEIIALPQGCNTVLGQDTALSGGQGQCAAITRAILLDTPAIMLDRATAVADPESETEIQQALSAPIEDCAVLVIVHQPAVVRGAGRITVMDGGRIVVTGAYGGLTDKFHYRALLRQIDEIEGATEVDSDKTEIRTVGPALAGSAIGNPDDGVIDSAADGGALAAVASHIGDRGGWTGVACPELPAPGGSFQPADSLLSHFRWLMIDSSWRQTRGCIALARVSGALVELALLVLLPASTILATGTPRWGLSFGGQLVVLVVPGPGTTVCDLRGRRMGISGTLGFIHDAHYTVGDRITRLPLCWFTADFVGTLSRAANQEMVVPGEPAAHFVHLLTSTAAACMIVGVGSWVWDWCLGFLPTLAMPLFAGLVRLSRRLLDHSKLISEPTKRELVIRIVETARCQDILRSYKAVSGYSCLTATSGNGT